MFLLTTPNANRFVLERDFYTVLMTWYLFPSLKYKRNQSHVHTLHTIKSWKSQIHYVCTTKWLFLPKYVEAILFQVVPKLAKQTWPAFFEHPWYCKQNWWWFTSCTLHSKYTQHMKHLCRDFQPEDFLPHKSLLLIQMQHGLPAYFLNNHRTYELWKVKFAIQVSSNTVNPVQTFIHPF